MQKFMGSMVNQTTVGSDLTRFGVILYSTNVNTIFTLKQYLTKRDVLQAISALKPPTGDTYTSKALDYSLEYFNEEYGGRAALQVPQVLMVITDGDATDASGLDKPSKALLNQGISVISVGVDKAKVEQLEIMTGGDKSRVFFVDNFNALETLYKNITQALCDTIPKPGKEQMLLHR